MAETNKESLEFKQIVAPVLGASYGDNVEKVFKDINSNFTLLSNKDFLKGDDGTNYVTKEYKLYKGPNDPTPFPGKDKFIVDMLKNAIAIDTAAASPINGTTVFDNLSSDKNLSIYLAEDGKGNVISSLPFTFIDARFYPIIQGGDYADQIDYSCILTYDGKEFVKHNAFPTLYFDKTTQKFCWRFQGINSGLPAQGPKGFDGEAGQVFVTRFNSDQTKTNTFIPITDVMDPNRSITDDAWVPIKNEKIVDNAVAVVFDTNTDPKSLKYEYWVSPIIKVKDDAGVTTYYISKTDDNKITLKYNTGLLKDLLDKIDQNPKEDTTNLQGLYVPININDVDKSGHLIYSQQQDGQIDKTELHIRPVANVDSPDYEEYSGSTNPVLSLDYLRIQTLGCDAKSAYATASGSYTIASGEGSHAEGYSTTSSGEYGSHAEGYYTTASGDYGSHAEGCGSEALGDGSHAEGGYMDFTTNKGGTAIGMGSHAEGQGTRAIGIVSHAEGESTITEGKGSHAEGESTTASGESSHAEGIGATASGDSSHVEGYLTTAAGEASHAEGSWTTAGGWKHNTNGNITLKKPADAVIDQYTQIGNYSHTEGLNTTAYGHGSHAEGIRTMAFGEASHVEGYESKTSGDYSHVEGYNNNIYNLDDIDDPSKAIHIEGCNNNIKSMSVADGGHVEGTYCKGMNKNCIHIVGNGDASQSSNAHVITKNGKHYIPGIGGYKGTEDDSVEHPLPKAGDLASVINTHNIHYEELLYISNGDTAPTVYIKNEDVKNNINIFYLSRNGSSKEQINICFEDIKLEKPFMVIIMNNYSDLNDNVKLTTNTTGKYKYINYTLPVPVELNADQLIMVNISKGSNKFLFIPDNTLINGILIMSM